ncbi:MAG: Hsp20/alpha crystallin family protein [Brumimicrobium sp.]|nr:Hsp20/alpha crystallin family protein [Brumimicrobium sp.]MCO5267939.1 Hsp20/alpha crystallin family protein [Brumimicrobium sp.]
MEVTRRNSGFLPSFLGDFTDDFFRTHQPSKFNEAAVNILERENDYVVELAVPGINKQDINIEIDGNKLSISGEAKAQNEVKEENYTLREFSYGSFRRSFTLPKDIDVQSVQADYIDGVLRVIVPKPELKKKIIKKIEVK